MSALYSAIASFFTNLILKGIGAWRDRKETQEIGEQRALRDAERENAERKAKADAELVKPIKQGDDLVDSIRDRSKFFSDD